MTISNSNDGGLVAALMLLVGFLVCGLLLCLWLYVLASKESEKRAPAMLRLISGYANISNAVVHLLLILLLRSNTKKYVDAGIDDAENVTGPLVLLVINGLLGIRTIRGHSLHIPAGWNSFVLIAGSLLPVVWQKFLISGLASWPYEILFIWICIWAFESLACFSSVALFILPNAKKPSQS